MPLPLWELLQKTAPSLQSPSNGLISFSFACDALASLLLRSSPLPGDNNRLQGKLSKLNSTCSGSPLLRLSGYLNLCSSVALSSHGLAWATWIFSPFSFPFFFFFFFNEEFMDHVKIRFARDQVARWPLQRMHPQHSHAFPFVVSLFLLSKLGLRSKLFPTWSL